MAIKGNVISCDECGRQFSMPMEPGFEGKQSLDARVRVHAAQEGWTCTDQRHICLDHALEAELGPPECAEATGRTIVGEA
jgi:hypothetical protein